MTDDRFYSMRGRGGSERVVVPQSAGALQSISFTSTPSTNIFEEGEKIPLSQFKVEAVYANMTIDVSNACVYMVNNPVEYGDTAMTVMYGSLTLTWNYTVTGSPVHAPANTYLLAHFDGNTKDEVSGNNLSIINPNPTYTPGVFSQACDAHTSNNRPSTSNIPNLSRVLAGENDPFTITFWSDGTSNTQTYAQFAYGLFNTGDRWGSVLGIRYELTQIKVTAYTTSTVRPAETTANTGLTSADYNGTFHHHAIEVGNKLVRFYFDGILKATVSLSSLQGNRPTQNNFAVSVVDELMICKGNIYGGNSFTPPHGPYYL
jgi:hypothetical protein